MQVFGIACPLFNDDEGYVGRLRLHGRVASLAAKNSSQSHGHADPP